MKEAQEWLVTVIGTLDIITAPITIRVAAIAIQAGPEPGNGG